MMRRMLLALLLLAAAPAGAVWGPSAGGQFFQPSETGAERLLGWEVGLAAFGPEGQGFWHFNYGQAKDESGVVTLTSMAARLNFRLTGGKTAFLYAGGGIARDQAEAAGTTRKAWVESIQVGFLLSPASLLTSDRIRAIPNDTAPAAGPGTAKSLNIGIEGGYRWGKTGFGGVDARVFLLLGL